MRLLRDPQLYLVLKKMLPASDGNDVRYVPGALRQHRRDDIELPPELRPPISPSRIPVD